MKKKINTLEAEMFNFYKNIASKRNFKILPTPCRDFSKHFQVRCLSCKKTFLTHLWKVHTVKHSCDHGSSKFEKKIIKLLEKSTGYKFPKQYPLTLINPETNANLELDGYNEYLKMAIEVDGPHHESPKFIYKDKIKNLWCKQNNIYLIRIKWRKKYKYARESLIRKLRPFSF